MNMPVNGQTYVLGFVEAPIDSIRVFNSGT